MKKLSKLLLFVATVFFFSTVTEPISSLADSPPTQNFEEEFFNDKGNLEDLTYKELDKLSDSELKDLGVYTGEDAEEFTEEILDVNFDFEAAVEDLDISKMDYAEKDKFLKIVKETATISGTDEVELLEEALMNLFDGSSETFNDLEATQQELEEKYEEQLNTDDDTLFSKVENFFAADKAYAAKKKGKIAVGVNLAAAAFNVVIFGVVGGTVFGVKNYIKKKGAKKAKETLSRVATAQAKKLKIKTIRGVSIATIIGVAIDFALNYYNPGSIIANIIDSKDWYKKNGWIDITK
ncbi:hypothetical protein M3599_23375 [Niallia circulans]|uniref:hypothetical protein n=1 Tax=Niallia circulans TaxID=1397 RepID=UPI0020424C9A|nr:hypothetical protein [Niallia circulans]MCM2983839.1 hypothetical protein [Niallia circulans]